MNASPTPREAREPWTAQEIAKKYRVSDRHITKMAKEGKIPGILVGGTWRFDPDEVNAALKELTAITRARTSQVEAL